MKTLLLLLALSIPCATADETSYTRTAFECMKQKKCTVGVNKLTPDSYDGEARDIIKNLDRIGVSVHIAAPRYFIDEYRGVYFPDKNSIYINKRYINRSEKFLSFIQILRHEGWPVAQDCMAGSLYNSDMQAILSHESIPEHITEETFARYGFDPTVVRIEREAVMAMYEPNMTTKALEACNSDTPIWETYFPPKKTWKYLYWNGHL